MLIAFGDESGTPSPADGERVFTVALLVVQDLRHLKRIVRRARRSLRRRARTSELKASRSHPRVIHRVLSALSQAECEIYVTAVDKRGITARQGEVLYRAAVARVVRHCVERHPRINLCLDKRYTNRTQQAQLEHAIRESIAHVSTQVVLIEQRDSWAVPGLQAVDFVAWAFEQKYALGDDWAAQLVAEKVVVEEEVRGIKIAALPGGR